mmetsp:Transcript_2518/g.7387  ORF Transcript_2518/g.7387 Transcript_2518/m.7387 type:complete len:216 (-) Transcript_2518:117-764(-)
MGVGAAGIVIIAVLVFVPRACALLLVGAVVGGVPSGRLSLEVVATVVIVLLLFVSLTNSGMIWIQMVADAAGKHIEEAAVSSTAIERRGSLLGASVGRAGLLGTDRGRIVRELRIVIVGIAKLGGVLVIEDSREGIGPSEHVIAIVVVAIVDRILAAGEAEGLPELVAAPTAASAADGEVLLGIVLLQGPGRQQGIGGRCDAVEGRTRAGKLVGL